MIKSTLTAATLALLLAGPAFADDDDRDRGDRHSYRHDDDRRHDGWDYDRRRYDDDWRYDDRYKYKYKHRDRRHVPPSRYRADYGYRSAYELAWSDWARYGRHDRRWNRSIPKRYRGDQGYRAGYESGWRDAVRYYDQGYRPHYWSRDPRGHWFYGLRIG
jgi:hypothetical protein